MLGWWDASKYPHKQWVVGYYPSKNLTCFSRKIHPGRLTWNQNITQLKRKIILQTIMTSGSMSIFQGVMLGGDGEIRDAIALRAPVNLEMSSFVSWPTLEMSTLRGVFFFAMPILRFSIFRIYVNWSSIMFIYMIYVECVYVLLVLSWSWLSFISKSCRPVPLAQFHHAI